MDRDDILSELSSSPPSERPRTSAFRRKAHSIICSSPAGDINALPTALLDLLSHIIKPLFIKTNHPQLTSTGRKNLVPGPPSSIASRFLNDPLEDDEDAKPWKTPFTIPLLEYILKSYMLLPFDPPDNLLRKTTIEAHFHLLIPPILNLIDDASPTPWKSSGCHVLALLCEVLVSTQSEMLKRSGLADVFIDALKTNFLLLPTMTTEEDSLIVLEEVYPAFLGIVDARFIKITSVQEGSWLDEKQNSSSTEATAKEFKSHQDMLTLVYRHGIMASLSHLSASSDSFSNTSSVPLTTFLLRRIPEIFTRTGIHSVKHFQGLLPMVRAGLADPFVLAAPPIVNALLEVLECVIQVGKPRVQAKWWIEILRGLILCWLNCFDETDGKITSPKKGSTGVEGIMSRLQWTAKSLCDVVEEEEWEPIFEELKAEEEDVKGLFEKCPYTLYG